ncbi:hypothetical protein SAMN05892877_110179 [Rhizobium subbaraonis]|uniref:Uncharacterized protein n=1 Tax=Rhizobium subbaraonis TaxID=908946 RepID=A0A285URJ1_9HYPH|nr:hypothetical protein SAMN05892877_110179 [Rhizobium subbaraonis]
MSNLFNEAAIPGQTGLRRVMKRLRHQSLHSIIRGDGQENLDYA